MTTTPWPKAISFFPVSVGGAGRAVGGVAGHGNILALLVAVCGLPTICLHAAAYLVSPFAPFRLLRKRACRWGGGHVSGRPRGHLLLLLAWLPSLCVRG